MKNNFIIIGDSISYGIGGKETGGWAELFKQSIVNKDDTKECSSYVQIAAYPGATSKDILDRAEAIFETFKSDESRNIVILAIGLNDTQELDGKNRISSMVSIENIQKLAMFFQERGDLIVVGLTKIEKNGKFFWKPSKYYDNNDIELYDSLIEKVSTQLCAEYIPLRDTLTSGDYADGVHPNDKGHQKIFDVVREKVKTYLNKNSEEI